MLKRKKCSNFVTIIVVDINQKQIKIECSRKAMQEFKDQLDSDATFIKIGDYRFNKDFIKLVCYEE